MNRQFSALPSEMSATLHASLAANIQAEDALARTAMGLPWPELVAGFGVMSLGNLVGSLWLSLAGAGLLAVRGMLYQFGRQQHEEVRAAHEKDLVDRAGVEFGEKLMGLLEVDLNPKRPVHITLASRPYLWPKVHAFSLGTRQKFIHPWFKLEARLADGPLLTLAVSRHCKFKAIPKGRGNCVYLERAADFVYLTYEADSALDSETLLGRLQNQAFPDRFAIQHWQLSLDGNRVSVKLKLTPGENYCRGFGNVQKRNFSTFTLQDGQGLLTAKGCLALLIWLFRGLGNGDIS